MVRIRAVLACILIGAAAGAYAQLPVVGNPDHTALLSSPDPKLAANKKLVYDFWREVFEGGHMELVPKYMAESYMQHNPNVPTGRAGFLEAFAKFAKPKPIEPKIAAPLVAILAEGPYVQLVWATERPDPKDSAKKYSTTWFDLFRIENGMVAEHWDPAQKRAP